MSAEATKKRIEEIGTATYTGTVYPRLGLRTSRLAYVLLAGEPGDVILDEQWPPELKGVAPKGKSYASLMSATRYALRAHGIVWERIRGEGRIKCLEHDERVQSAGSRITCAGRRARVAGQVLNATDRDALSSDERAQANALGVQAAMIHRAAAQKLTKALGARDADQQKRYLESYLVDG